MTATLARPDTLPADGLAETPPVPPRVHLPRLPSASTLWTRGLIILWACVALFFLERLTKLLMDFWFFQSLGFDSVFWINFRTGAILWVIATVVFTASITVPAALFGRSRRVVKHTFWAALLAGLIIGYHFAGDYRDYLRFFNAQPFGQTDPIFHHDIGFYVFRLPAIWTTLRYALWATLTALVSCVGFSWSARPVDRPVDDMNPVATFAGAVGTPATLAVVGFGTVLLALQVFFGRYNLLVKNNSSTFIPAGPSHLDVAGVVSTLNYIYLMVFVVVGRSAAAFFILRRLHRRFVSPVPIPRSGRTRKALFILLALEALELFGARTVLSIRNMTQIKPNEPSIQIGHIEAHLAATRTAWGLDGITTKEITPPAKSDPQPDLNALVNSPTFKNANAPLWPGFTSYLSTVVNPYHADRYLRTGDDKVLAVTMDSFQQQQKLRAYYNFLGVDTVRYPVNGEPHLFASSAREVPLNEPKPWLSWWGQRFLLFTHGHGLVMAPLGARDANGQPQYASSGIPIRTADPALATPQPAVYYGEGSGSMAYSDIRNLKELDYATDEGRAQVEYPQNVAAGVKVNSLLKRVVFGWRSRQFFQITFSNLITNKTRVHYYRTPMERVERVVPFLYFDTNPYAVASEGGIEWMANGIAATDRYPLSARAQLGQKTDERSTAPRPFQRANYARDAVKATIDAYTGQVHFYAFSNDPIMRTWEHIYPKLFIAKAAMPTTARQQVMYPIQLFHAQMDDIYSLYHMPDALTFYNQEDKWRAGNQVLGPMIAAGPEITFPIEPYYWIAQSGGSMPPSSVDEQFAMSMPFTNNNALNLRGIPTVYMSGSDYGRMSVLTVPKGQFVIGPEQADASIDQDSFISQQIGFWNRRGTEVIRGQLTTVMVDNELIYLEPLFIRSKQNPVPQLKRVVVVTRGRAAMGRNLGEALQLAVTNRAPSFGLEA